jgi:hypothetical protein
MLSAEATKVVVDDQAPTLPVLSTAADLHVVADARATGLGAGRW